MTVRISTAARNASADAIAALINVGTNGVLRIYSGTQPATPATTPSGTMLAEFALSDPAFAAAIVGVATLDVTPALTDTGITNGTAGYFRIVDSAEAAGTGLGILDGSITATGGGGDLTMNTVTISTGVNVTVTAGTLTANQ